MLFGPVVTKLAQLKRGVKFSVVAENDIHISLSNSNPVTSDSWEIVFGSWGGMRSYIRNSHQGQNLVTIYHTKEQFLEVVFYLMNEIKYSRCPVIVTFCDFCQIFEKKTMRLKKVFLKN